LKALKLFKPDKTLTEHILALPSLYTEIATLLLLVNSRTAT